MGLSNDLLSQFAKITNNQNEKQSQNLYGTVVKYGDSLYVQIDGSEMLTPMSSTVTAKAGDRVIVAIENHRATATGNLSTPSASSAVVGGLSDQVFHKVSAEEIDVVNASLDNIKAITIKTEYAEIVNADIENLKAKLVDVEHLSADDIKAINAEIENLEAKVGTFENLSADDLKAINGEITNLKGYTADFTYVSAEVLTAVKATIKELEATIIDAETGNFKFANIDFSNIGKAAIEQFFATSGLIKDVVVGDQTITGELVGVTIKGDLIEGGTVKADKLVIKGEDGLFYKLNVDALGETTASSDDKYQNGLDGSVIIAKSITATKIDVKDLVAFGATIGGFKISDNAIYSGVKESVDNTTRGTYLDKDGQVAFGDGNNYIKYLKDVDGNYHLLVSASEIILGTGKTVEETIDDIQIGAKNLIRNSETLDFEDYYFAEEPLVAESDGDGTTAVTYNPLETTEEDGTVEAKNINAEDDGEGTVSAYSLTEEGAENPKESHEMDTLVMDGKSFEVVDKKARQEIAVERGRIDQFVRLEDGSTTGDAELKDIRVGYDGVEHDAAGDAVRAIGNDLEAHKQEFDDYTKNKAVNGLYYEDNQLYLTTNGEISSDPVEIKQGSGSGTGTVSILKLTNANPNNTFSATVGGDVILRFTFLSLEDDIPTGDGTCAISVNGITKTTFTIQQGLNEVNVKDYLSVGSNTVRITCTDIYGQYRSLSYIGSVIELSVESTFDDTVTYNGDVTFKYTLYGLIEKTAHFIMDGVEVDTKVVKTSGTQYTKILDAMPHGVHRLEMYSTAVLDGEDIESNHLVYDIMCVEDGVTGILIASPFTMINATQGEQISIPYSVYNPAALSTDVTLTIYTMSAGSRNVYAETPITVDRTRQTWNTRKYPIGDVYFEIKAGEVVKTHKVAVTTPTIEITPEQNDLELELLASGRSNNESDPAHWAYGDVTTAFDHVNWDSTGWVADEDGDTALRLNGAAAATIHYKPFSKDLRIYGKTIEMEFVIRDVNNREAVVIDCMSGGIGIKATADRAILSSELASVDCQYKEDVKVKAAFTIEARNEKRMMSVYLNGVLSGTKQYTTTDNFQQTAPVDIKIGSPYCAIDLYSVRVYDTALNAATMLNNYIADIQDIGKKIEIYENNNIFDEYGRISYSLVKDKLPTITIIGKLPTAKGNKQNVTFIFKDPRYPSLDFEADCVIDVQGTSSQYYVVKNLKIKFAEAHQHAPDMMETKVFCIKVDYAEATGTHNTQFANFVHTLYEEKNPPQIKDERIRTTIYGFPCVVFHQESVNSEPVFYGKANFNYDKGSENVFGFTDEYDVECWEFCNNTSDVCNFRAIMPEKWDDDFEARYPEDNKNISRLADLIVWVQNTKNNLTQFKNEFEDHFNLESVLIYYIMTLFVLGVDQRAKNMMFVYWAATGKWYLIFYDNDTIFCIDNEGNKVFSYWHEDIDQLDGANVFNGQNSVFWNNFRIAFADEIAAKYRELRSSGKLTYDALINYFIENGSDMWSEAIYNTDSQTKYIAPLNDGDASNLYQVRGDGEMHLMYFLENRFKYMDSKFYAEDYADDYVYFRIYTPVDAEGNPRTDLAVPACADVTVTTYTAMYAGIRYKANGTLQQQRAMENETVHFEAPDETFNDTETSVYGASCISSLGDLSALYLGSINTSKATHIIELILGSPVEGYDNPNLTEITVGNNRLLKLIDIRNCSKLTESLDLSGCPNIEEVYADGSAITGIDLVKGGHVRVLQLPDMIKNLTLLNQHYIEDFAMAGYDNLKTMRIENCAGVDEVTILRNATNLERVRLVGVDWHLEDVSFLKWLYTSGIAGIDETGANVDEIQVSGKCYIEKLTGAEYAEITSKWPYLEISYGYLSSYLYFMSEDGTEELAKQLIENGGDGIDPVTAGTIETPTKESTAQYHFTFNGWSKVVGGDADGTGLKNVTGDRYVYAAYSKTIRSYTVNFLNYDGTVLQSGTVEYGTDATYTGSTPTNNSTGDTSDFTFTGWKPSPTNIQGDTDCYAQFYDTREITDDWKTIGINSYSGFYVSKYPVGSYKNVFVGATMLPFDFYNGGATVYNDEIHIIGGMGGSRKHYKWNGIEWAEVSVLPFDYAMSPAVVYNDEIYIVGNHYGGYETKMYKFEGTSWSYVAETPYNFYNSGFLVVVYKDEMYLLSQNYHDVYKWNDGEWALISTFPSSAANAVVMNDNIYITSANDSKFYKGDGVEWEEVECKGAINSSQWGHSATTVTVMNDTIHYFGSMYDRTSHWTWNEVDGWRKQRPLSFKLLNGKAVAYNNDIYLLGGENGKKDFMKLTNNGWIPPGTTDVIPMEVIDHDHDETPDDEFMFVPSDIPKLPTYGRCVVHNNELYSIWANHDKEGNSYKYNASTKTWDLLCENTPTMALWPTLLSYNGEIHSIGGTSKQGTNQTLFTTQHLKWDGTTWTVLDTLPFSCLDPFYACVYKNKIHVVNGGTYTNQLGHHYVYDGTSWTEIESGFQSKHPIFLVFVWNDVLYALGTNYFWTYDGAQWSDATAYETGKKPSIYSNAQVMIHNDTIYIISTIDKTDHVITFDGTGFTEVYNKTSTQMVYYNTMADVVYYNSCWYAVSFSDVRNRKISWGGFEKMSEGNPNATDDAFSLEYKDKVHSFKNYKHYTWDGNIGSTLDDVPVSTDGSRIIVHDNEIHILGGGDSSSGNTNHYKWNPDDGWAEVSTLPYVFRQGCAVSYNGQIHILGGTDVGKLHYKWDGSEWSEVGVLPGTSDFVGCGAVSYNGEIHAFGFSNDGWLRKNMHYKWNPDDGWVEVGIQLIPCQFPHIFVLKNEIHIIGNRINESYKKKHAKWNGSDWSMLPETPIAFDRSGVTVFRGKIYAIGSGVAGYYYSTWVYENPKAPLTFCAKNTLSEERQFNDTGMGWNVFYPKSTLRMWMNGEFFESLPSALQSAISPVKKYTGDRTDGVQSSEEKCWIMSREEVGVTGGYFPTGEGTAYPVFTDNSSRIRCDADGNAREYFTRTRYTANGNVVNAVAADGIANAWRTLPSGTASIVPCFCI